MQSPLGRYRDAIFFASGFVGLIYESIWAHYLKLFLGHAAYAQTLVLTIFMGGMAIGAWLASRYSMRWKRLILGYAESVWTDAEAAFETGAFDAVIASPEAAEHWPGDILAIAHTDEHAERLARMHGFDDAVFCGRSEREAA